MTAVNTDRNLLFGVLALQMNFVGRDALLSAMSAWLLDRAKPLGQILVDQEALLGPRRDLLDSLVREQLQAHHAIDSVSETVPQVAGADVQASLHLDQDTPPAAASALVRVASPPRTGGRFRALRPHARGGLGEVFVAHDGELGREVALKEIRPQHADNPDHRARFLTEAEITGRLEHPGIVPVYGLGTHADGRPFYAMRLIRGETLRQAIERFHHPASGGCQPPEGATTPRPRGVDTPRSPSERNLALRGLLRRFLDVRNAVEYAHSRGVIHRDLKPANILLGPYGETLVVDWGLAKTVGTDEQAGELTEQPLGTTTASGATPTHVGQAVGTPQFMSPEQAAGRIDELGPATDIYSLGATLYAVLTGEAPYGGERVREVLDKVRQGEVVPPRQLNRLVPPALQAICLKAMAPSPLAERYGSARALADDLEHWLADEPVTAYREPLPARLQRLGRRHRALVSGGAALLVTAVVALGVGLALLGEKQRETEQARRDAVAQKDEAERQRKQAERQSAIARAESRKVGSVARFLVGMLEASDPTGLAGYTFFTPRAGEHNPTARDLLDRGTAKIAAELKDEPEVQATLLNTIGNAYRALGQYPEAEKLLTAALERRRKILGENHPDFAASLHNRAWLHHDKGEYDAAEKLYRRTLTLREKLLPADDPALDATRFNLAWLLALMNEYTEAETLFQAVLQRQQKRLGEKHRDTALTHFGLAAIYLEQEQLPAALQQTALAMKAFGDGPGEKDLARAIGLFQKSMFDRQVRSDHAAAEQALRECLGLARKALGKQHVYEAVVLAELAVVVERRDTAEAEKIYRESLQIARRRVGLRHPRVEVLVSRFGKLLAQRGKADEARALHEELIRTHRQCFGARHRLVGNALSGYGEFLMGQGDDESTALALEEALAIYREVKGTRPRQYLSGLNNLATAYQKRGKYVEAEKLLREARPLVKEQYGATSRNLAVVLTNLAQIQMYQRKYDKAVEELLRDARSIHLLNRWLPGKPPGRPPATFGALIHYYQATNRLSEASAAAQDLAKQFSKDPAALFEAACETSRCITLTRDETQKKQFADQAMRLLRQAVSRGFQDVQRLNQEPLLEPLREAADFRKLVAELEPRRERRP